MSYLDRLKAAELEKAAKAEPAKPTEGGLVGFVGTQTAPSPEIQDPTERDLAEVDRLIAERAPLAGQDATALLAARRRMAPMLIPAYLEDLRKQVADLRAASGSLGGHACDGCENIRQTIETHTGSVRRFWWSCSKGHKIMEASHGPERVLVAPSSCLDRNHNARRP